MFSNNDSLLINECNVHASANILIADDSPFNLYVLIS